MQLHTGLKSVGNADAALRLASQMARDLQRWLDASWVMIASVLEGDLVALHVVGAECRLSAKATMAVVEAMRSTSGIVEVDGVAENGTGPRVVVPLRLHDAPSLGLVLGPRSGRAYTAADYLLISEVIAHIHSLLRSPTLAARIGMSFSEHDQLDEELACARSIRRRFLPATNMHVNGIDCFGDSRQFSSLGSDLFDTVGTTAYSLSVSLGSVCGGGVPEAIILTGIHATLRTATAQSGTGVAALMDSLNRMVWSIAPEHLYVRLFCAHIDTRTRLLTYVNAGAEPPLLIRPQLGSVRRLHANGAVLGLSRNSRYTATKVAWQPGDILIGATDSLAQAMEEEWAADGSRQLVRWLQDRTERTAIDVVEHLLGEAEQCAKSHTEPGDWTALAIRFLPDVQPLSRSLERMALAV